MCGDRCRTVRALVTPRPLSAVVILVFRSRTEVRHETESGQGALVGAVVRTFDGRLYSDRRRLAGLYPVTSSAEAYICAARRPTPSRCPLLLLLQKCRRAARTWRRPFGSLA